MSPIRDVRDIDVPMLILHSEDDLRCPIVQAEELFMALRLLGKDVTFYRFPGEGHELSRSGSPVHRRMRAEIILDFFTEKLQPRSATQASMSLRAMEMPGGIVRQRVAPVPAGVDDLGRVELELAGHVAGAEPDHQAVRERPRLAAPVADVADDDRRPPP